MKHLLIQPGVAAPKPSRARAPRKPHEFKPYEVKVRRGIPAKDLWTFKGQVWEVKFTFHAPFRDMEVLHHAGTEAGSTILRFSENQRSDSEIIGWWQNRKFRKATMRKLAETADRESDHDLTLWFTKESWMDILYCAELLGITPAQWALGCIRWKAEIERDKIRKAAERFLEPPARPSPFGRFEASLEKGRGEA